MTTKISIFSFFSGSGFLDLGFELNSYNLCFVNEFHKPFLKAYQYSRNLLNIDEPEFGYSNKVISEYLTGKDLLFLSDAINLKRKKGIVGFIGGPPCPDFSVGGKNKGRSGDNGKLSEIYIELIRKCKPDFFLFENVKGLWRTQKHRHFYEELKRKINKDGFVTTERLINAIEYGVPQDRDRIILLGFRKKFMKEHNLKPYITDSLSNGAFPWENGLILGKQKIFSLPWPKTSKFIENSELPPPIKIKKKLTVKYWFDKNDVANHPNSIHCFRPRSGLKRFSEIDEGDDSRKSFKRLHRWRYSPTACYGNNEVHLHPYKIRRINVAEALSIQSLPKNFALPEDMSLTDMFKTIGNGVPYLAAKSLSENIKYFMEK